jgi:phosphate acetyltransferase
MNFVTSIIDKLQRHPKRILFPEGEEPRVIQAARQFYAMRLGVPILLGDPKKIKQVAVDLRVPIDHIGMINPIECDSLTDFAKRYEVLRKYKNIQGAESIEVMKNPLYFGAMMLWTNQVDGLVSGASHTTGSVLRPLFQIIKTAPDSKVVSSCMIIETNDSSIGDNGVLFFADCGVIPDPTVEQLSDLSVSTARLARQLTGIKPRVAMLSFSTKGSAKHPTAEKMAAAAAMAREEAKREMVDMEVDGELQADTALIPDIARAKITDSMVAGRANVLIFPDLNAGNIATKLVQRIGKTNAFGQILLGLARPAVDLSRGCSTHDILGVAAIVGLQAIEYRHLYPHQQ